MNSDMFEMNRLLDREVEIKLQMPSQEVKALLRSVGHKKFMASWQRRFPISPDNTTSRAGVFWLSRWCLNGGSSQRYASQCQDIFDSLLPFTYQRFRDVGFNDGLVCNERYK